MAFRYKWSIVLHGHQKWSPHQTPLCRQEPVSRALQPRHRTNHLVLTNQSTRFFGENMHCIKQSASFLCDIDVQNRITEHGSSKSRAHTSISQKLSTPTSARSVQNVWYISRHLVSLSCSSIDSCNSERPSI